MARFTRKNGSKSKRNNFMTKFRKKYGGSKQIATTKKKFADFIKVLKHARITYPGLISQSYINYITKVIYDVTGDDDANMLTSFKVSCTEADFYIMDCFIGQEIYRSLSRGTSLWINECNKYIKDVLNSTTLKGINTDTFERYSDQKSVPGSSLEPAKSSVNQRADVSTTLEPAKSSVNQRTDVSTTLEPAKSSVNQRADGFDATPDRPKPAQSVQMAQRPEVYVNPERSFAHRYAIQNVCTKSGSCIAFGAESDKIKTVFNEFDLEHVHGDINRISKGSNGFINELMFKHEENSYYAVLKSTSESRADNLMYEYKVGLFLNTVSKLYPCFLETYKLYKYNTPQIWEYAQRTKKIPPSIFKTLLTEQPYNLVEACRSSKYIAILIQHLKGAISFYKLLIDGPKSFNYDFFTLLYQVYFILDVMKDVFTHYDLHGGNVLLYELSPDKYVQYHYHSADRTIAFKSIYLAKIIDYGRCYFNESADIKKILCGIPECTLRVRGFRDQPCGDGFGFSSLNGVSEWHLNSSVKNESHDLKLIYSLSRQIKQEFKNLTDFTRKRVDYINNHTVFKDEFGTPEQKDCNQGDICNVSSVCDYLIHVFKYMNLDAMFNLYYSGRTKLGDMHIYSDGTPFTFIYS